MAVSEVRVALQPQEPLWELPLRELQGTALALIGWIQTENPVDSGVPDTVASVLANTLTSTYKVTYPRPPGSGSNEWQSNSEGWVRTLRSDVTLLCTHQPESAARLFHTNRFIWSLKTQVAILSAITAPPPPLTDTQVIQLLECRFDWKRLASAAAIQGLLQPGVDGDFAGLSVFEGGLDDALAQLRAECDQANIRFQIVPEAEFRTTQWIPEP